MGEVPWNARGGCPAPSRSYMPQECGECWPFPVCLSKGSETWNTESHASGHFQGAGEPGWVLDVPSSCWGRECPVDKKRFHQTAEVDTGPDTSVLLTREGLGLVSFCRAASLCSAKIQIPCYGSSSSLSSTFSTKALTFPEHALLPVGMPHTRPAPEGQERAFDTFPSLT